MRKPVVRSIHAVKIVKMASALTTVPRRISDTGEGRMTTAISIPPSLRPGGPHRLSEDRRVEHRPGHDRLPTRSLLEALVLATHARGLERLAVVRSSG